MRVDNFDIKAVATLDDLKKFVSQTIAQIVTIINGKITFADNIDCRLVSTSFAAINKDTPVSHGLNRIPVGYILAGASAPMSIYNGTGASTNSSIYLRSNATGSASILVF